MKCFLGLLEKSARSFQRAPLGRRQPFAAEEKNPFLNRLLQFDHLSLQRRRLAGADGRLQRRNISRGFLRLGFHFLPSGRGRTAGHGFRWRRQRSRLLGLDGGRRSRCLHNNALVRLRWCRSRRRRRNVYNLRPRLPLRAAAKNNGNTENCCFPAQGFLILSLQQRSWAEVALPSGFVKKANRYPAGNRVHSKRRFASAYRHASELDQTQASDASGRMVTRNLFFSCLCLLLVLVFPFVSLLQDKGLGIFKRSKEAFSLDHIARLAAGHKVIHPSCPAMGVRVNMVNGKNHPVRELVQPIQSTILALKLITSEYLHGVFPRQVWRGPGEKLLELVQGHGSSSRTQVR